MESQALGFSDGVGRDLREEIELGLELSHIDFDGYAMPTPVIILKPGLKLGAVSVQPRAYFVGAKGHSAALRLNP